MPAMIEAWRKPKRVVALRDACLAVTA